MSMDLGQDWDALHRTLYPRKKTKGSSESETVFVAHHSERTLRIVGDRDELLFTTGSALSETVAMVGEGRRPVAIDVAEMDRAISAALRTEGAIYEQVRAVRGELSPSKGKLQAWEEHFLLSAVRTG